MQHPHEPEASLFAPHLLPLERVFWTGRPRQGLAWRREDNTKAPFSVLWLAFVLCWLSLARSMNAGPLFLGVGVAFSAIGVYFVFGRFFADAYARTRERYALTDRRALFLSGKRLMAIELESIGQLHFLPNKAGRGTIVFGPVVKGVVGSYEGALKPRSPEFFEVRDADAVYTLLKRARDEVLKS